MTIKETVVFFALFIASAGGCVENTGQKTRGIDRYCIDGVMYVRPIINGGPFTLLVDPAGKPRTCSVEVAP